MLRSPGQSSVDTKNVFLVFVGWFGLGYVWTVSRSETTSVDKDALKADGLLDKYSKKSETYRMTVK